MPVLLQDYSRQTLILACLRVPVHGGGGEWRVRLGEGENKEIAWLLADWSGNQPTALAVFGGHSLN